MAGEHPDPNFKAHCHPTCRSDGDGDCYWQGCPQLRDDEPSRNGRHCPLDIFRSLWEELTDAGVTNERLRAFVAEHEKRAVAERERVIVAYVRSCLELSAVDIARGIQDGDHLRALEAGELAEFLEVDGG